ncbi:UPF0472 protein C16orf72 homolog isoform X2 [Amphibalanus amphitrite]|nr:UPF0472 protein C16orf72 homolog isoform X2 [Amphibalanus amphitrite]
MSEERGSDDELYRWEAACYSEVDSQPDYELQLHQERELTAQKLWHLFQSSATCIAHLHKGAYGGTGGGCGTERGGSRWMPFQTAAGSVTALYKESVDGVRRCTELGILHGQQRRTRELLALTRRRRLLRREEVLSLLCGRPPPPPRSGHRSSSRHQSAAWSSAGGRERESPPSRPGADSAVWNGISPALGGFRPPSPAAAAAAAPAPALLRRSPSRRRASRSLSPLDLTAVKRPATPSSPCDVVMDSPTHKRPRYT